MSRFSEMRREWERQTLIAAIAEHGSNAKAAEALGLNRTHFLKRLIVLGIREHNPMRTSSVGWARVGL
jgi:DNA-binding NtrC family response regulator